ncbi:MAG: hypothetical protein LBP23_07965 [Treponema sp.]|jgi:hypothetical protein|nr:hypothetical protein [Treponema sp.]
MKADAWKQFIAARSRFRRLVARIDAALPALKTAQQKLVDNRGGPAYTVETPVVYNGALEDIGPGSEIKLILVADNPGRREQAAENRRYLVGPSGKIAEKFFRDNPELGIDFRKNVIILNKTPIHTPRTAELRDLCRPDAAVPAGGGAGAPAPIGAAVAESQEAMARLLLEFHRALAPASCAGSGGGGSPPAAAGGIPVWIIGYSEMRRGGIFEAYTKKLKELYAPFPVLKQQLFLYRHFSMNQFTIDLRARTAAGESLSETLERTGAAYRERMLGW